MINQEEIEKFEKLAPLWWDLNGPMKMLHQMNPCRLEFITKSLTKHFQQKNLSILDIGCGAGIITEPLSRLGHKVTGIDLSFTAIEIAKQRALDQSLPINYYHQSIESITKKFEVILALELLEHLGNSWSDFITQCKKNLTANGMIIFSTINRTRQSYIKAILIAEYLLKWVDVGTHDWQNFLQPAEVAEVLRKNNLKLFMLQGLEYLPFSKKWHTSNNLNVNYILAATF